MTTAIEWTDATWNPVTGCTKVSPGCANCYIERTPAFRMTGQQFVEGKIPVLLHPNRLEQPLRWRKPRRVFVVSMGDLFHEDVPDEFIYSIFDVMAQAQRHTFQVLTKRPERMRDFCSRLSFIDLAELAHLTEPGVSFSPSGRYADPRPLPNVWLGVSVENQRWADERIPLLLETPAAVRFLSCEPLLGPLNLRLCRHEFSGGPDAYRGSWSRCLRCLEMGVRGSGIDWVIVGGESGPGTTARKLVYRSRTVNVSGTGWGYTWQPRTDALEWVRSIGDRCQAAGVPFFFKQWGGPKPKSGGRLLDGREWNEMPQREAVPA